MFCMETFLKLLWTQSLSLVLRTKWYSSVLLSARLSKTFLGRMYRTIARVRYRSWVRDLPDDQIQAEDPSMVKQWRYSLYAYWDSNWRAHKKSGNEMELRHGIEGLVKLAFEVRLGATHIYKLVISSEWGSH